MDTYATRTEATESICEACGAIPGTPEYDNWHDSWNCWAHTRDEQIVTSNN